MVRERRTDLKQIYYKFRLPLDAVALLATGFLFSGGHQIIQFLYDDRYLPAGHMIEILCVGLFEVRYWLAGQCFLALGMPKLLVPISLIRLLSLFVLMPIAYSRFGLDGALWVAGGSALCSLPLTLYFKIKLGLFALGREIAVLPLLVVGYLMGLFLEQFLKIFL